MDPIRQLRQREEVLERAVARVSVLRQDRRRTEQLGAASLGRRTLSAPLLVPRVRASESTNALGSRLGSEGDSRPRGSSRASERRIAVVSLDRANWTSTVRSNGALASCRRSQLIRVRGRPSFGAGTLTPTRVCLALRSASTSIGPTAAGTRKEPDRAPRASRSESRVSVQLLPSRDFDWAEATCTPRSWLSPRQRYSTNCSQRSTTSRTPGSVTLMVPSRAEFRTCTQCFPMSSNPIAPDFSCSR